MNVGDPYGGNKDNGDNGKCGNDDNKLKTSGKHVYRKRIFILKENEKILGMIVYMIGDLQEENIPRTFEELDDTDDEW